MHRADNYLGTGTLRPTIAIAIAIAATIARVQIERRTVVGSNDLGSLFSETVGRRHHVGGPLDGEDGRIDNTEVRDAVHTELGIDDTTYTLGEHRASARRVEPVKTEQGAG